MGTKITGLLESKEVDINDLRGKTYTVDAHNILYQFLSSIRQRDGSYLTDSNGAVTSHLVGLFSRMSKLMMSDMKFIFCFDGLVPDLKIRELNTRKKAKLEAKIKYEKAKEEGDHELMKKYATRTSKLTPEMIEEAKKLIDAMGQEWIEAPSEGEAQAAHIAKNRDAYGVISQDADCFLFGAPRIIKNLTITGKRKMPGQQHYTTVRPEMYTLSDCLNQLGLDQDQLIILAILVGTDFNPKGIKGVGPKTALKLVKKYGDDFEKIFDEVEWKNHFDIGWQEVFYTIKQMKTSNDYKIKFSDPDPDKIREILIEKHDFEKERVESTLKKLEKALKFKQKGLGDFF